MKKVREFGKIAVIIGLTLILAPVILAGYVLALGVALLVIGLASVVFWVVIVPVGLPLGLAGGFRDLVREKGWGGAVEAVARPMGIVILVILAMLGVRSILDMIGA